MSVLLYFLFQYILVHGRHTSGNFVGDSGEMTLSDIFQILINFFGFANSIFIKRFYSNSR